MTLYFATVLPGIEYVLADEIRVKVADAKLAGVERGKVYFRSKMPLGDLLDLRTADNLYRFVHRFEVGPHKLHLPHIEQTLAGIDLSWVCGDRSGPVAVIVNASRAGKHTYSRFDAAEAALRGVLRRDSRCVRGLVGAHDAEFRLDLTHGEAVFALRLTDAAFRYRTAHRAFAQAALRPTVAHALVWLSQPQAADMFVDPCCGSGTILTERAAYPYAAIVGGDYSEEAVAIAKHNIGARDRVSVNRWDARRLPLDAGCADTIVSNLPFGRQIAVEESMTALYRDMLTEMKRVLKQDGAIVCLTDASDSLQQAAAHVQLRCAKEATLHLKGLHPTLFRLRKR